LQSSIGFGRKHYSSKQRQSFTSLTLIMGYHRLTSSELIMVGHSKCYPSMMLPLKAVVYIDWPFNLQDFPENPPWNCSMSSDTFTGCGNSKATHWDSPYKKR